MKFIVSIILCILTSLCFGQKENNFWFLNSGVGLDFNKIIAGPGASSEVRDFLPGSYSISSSDFVSYSDEDGNLLFYSNGKSVWNANHEFLMNGDDLIEISGGGDVQEAMAVRVGCEKYFLFYQVLISGSRGELVYSEIDMSLDGGLGGIVEDKKDQLLHEGPYRSFGVVQGLANSWLVGVFQSSATTVEFHAFKAGPLGVEQPVVSNVTIDDLRGINYGINFSRDGNFACLMQDGLLFDGIPMSLLSFDKETGTFDYLAELLPEEPPWEGYNSNIVSAMFSSNMKQLYTVERYGYCEQLECFTGFAVFQYAFERHKGQINESSKLRLAFYEIEEPPLGEMRLTPHGKIYINRYGHNLFDVILRPNSSGPSCGYVEDGLKLGSGRTSLWMPNLVLPMSEFQFMVNQDLSQPIPLCDGQSITLEVSDYYDTVTWSDGEDTYTKTFSESGKYWVEVTDGFCVHTQFFEIESHSSQNIYLPNDTTLCLGNILDVNFDTKPWADSLIWEDASVISTRQFDTQGTYYIDVIEEGCIYRDSLIVRYDLLPDDVLSNDTLKCSQDKLRLRASAFQAEYLWNTGDDTPTIDVIDEGLYKVTLTRGVCELQDSILVNNRDHIELIEDDFADLCVGEGLELDIASPGLVSYAWSTGDLTPRISTKETGLITVIADDDFCSFSDSIFVTRFHCSDAMIYIPNSFSPGTQSINNTYKIGIPDNLTYVSGTMTVYDRYGNIVGQLDDLREEWHGVKDGRLLGSGTYMAAINIEVEDTYGLQDLNFYQAVTIIR